MTDLINKIEAYRQKHLLEETTAGLILAGDPYLIRDLRDGKRRFRLRTIAQIEARMQKPPVKVGKHRLTKPRRK